MGVPVEHAGERLAARDEEAAVRGQPPALHEEGHVRTARLEE
jgi:hypothetical protein